MTSHCRRVRSEEIPEAVDVFLLGLADLARRNGWAPPAAYTRAAVEPLYRHIFETGIFEVVEQEGRIAVVCNAIVRDNIGFLCMFWALPELRLRGLGRPLIARVLAEAERQGARVLCTWSSVDYAAIGTYLKLGLRPGGPIFTFGGKPRSLPEAPSAFAVRPLLPGTASSIDRRVRGTERARDHEFWQASGVAGFQVEHDGAPVAYFYSRHGAIGPAAWLTPEAGPKVLVRALETASEQASEVKLITLGSNEAAVRIASEAGLHIVGSSHWMRSAPFGLLDQYLPSGPGLF